MPERPYPVAPGEADRLAELARYRVLDTAPEDVFDETVNLARSLFGVATSVVSLVDDERQWFKARAGLDACQTGRDVAFCTYAILGDDVMVVADARSDPRFADNPLVTGSPFIRFYAGAPLTTPSGHNIGTLCVFDAEPRPDGMSALDRRHLAMLARIVIERLDARRLQLERNAEAQSLRGAAERLTATAAGLDEQAQALAALSQDGAQISDAALQGVRRLVSIGKEVDRDIGGLSGDIAAAAANALVTRTTVGGLTSHIKDIVSVAGEIAGVARQTRMLAINASIQAAHAGEAGRGFEVIAREVGTLAATTAEATIHIRTALQAIETTILKSTERCDDLADLVGEMNRRSEAIVAAAALAVGTRHDVGGGIDMIVGMTEAVGAQAGTLHESTAMLLDEAVTLRTHARTLAPSRCERDLVTDHPPGAQEGECNSPSRRVAGWASTDRQHCCPDRPRLRIREDLERRVTKTAPALRPSKVDRACHRERTSRAD